MNDQIFIDDGDSFTCNIRLFFLGMAVAFLISIGVSHSNSSNIVSDHVKIDCDNAEILKDAQDRSRNGIVNGCPLFKVLH